MTDFDKFLADTLSFLPIGVTKIKKKFTNRNKKDILEKIDFLVQTFGMKREKVIEAIKIAPGFLDMPAQGAELGTIYGNYLYMQHILHLSKREMNAIFYAAPDNLTLDFKDVEKDSFHAGLSLYKKVLGLSDREIGDFLISMPDLLTKQDKYLEKIQKLAEIHMHSSTIKAFPRILRVPAQKTKFRYMVSRLMQPSKADLQRLEYPAGIMVNEKSLFARYCYLKEHKFYSMSDPKTREYFCQGSPGELEEKTGLKNDDLVEQYPITREKVKEVETEFNKRHISKLHLDEKELSCYPSSEDEAD